MFYQLSEIKYTQKMCPKCVQNLKETEINIKEIIIKYFQIIKGTFQNPFQNIPSTFTPLRYFLYKADSIFPVFQLVHREFHVQ